MEQTANSSGDTVLAVDLNLYAHDGLEERLLVAYREVPYPANQRLVELVESMTGIPVPSQSVRIASR